MSEAEKDKDIGFSVKACRDALSNNDGNSNRRTSRWSCIPAVFGHFSGQSGPPVSHGSKDEDEDAKIAFETYLACKTPEQRATWYWHGREGGLLTFNVLAEELIPSEDGEAGEGSALGEMPSEQEHVGK